MVSKKKISNKEKNNMELQNKTKKDRPLMISILCYIGFIGAFIVFLGLVVPATREKIIHQYGILFLAVGIIVALAGLIGLLGYWKMQKWGVYVYTSAIALSILYTYSAKIK